MAFLRRWFCREDGATAIEYGLIAAGIALVCAFAVYATGDAIVDMFGRISGYLNS